MNAQGTQRFRWLQPLAERYGLDIRSLALLRMGLALVILADLIMRLPDLTAHYTDQGILPRTTLIDGLLDPWYWSIHLISGQPLVQTLLFLTAALMALALLVGYRTRLATIALWALTVSLHARNPALLFAADSVLRTMLFWSMFLPLGAAYSIDSAMNPKAQLVPQRIFTGAAIAFTVQQCFIYMFSAFFKTTSPIWWPDLSAVYYSLSFDQYATGFGAWLLNFPALLKGFTGVTLVLEWVGPLLLFMPFRTQAVRTATVIVFILLHAGFGFTLHIGIFPFLSIATWLAFLPSSIWDGLARRVYREPQAGLIFYYDADCGFCKKMVHLIRTFLALPDTQIYQAQSDPSINADMARMNSWVVVDWQEQRHFKFEAIAYIARLSPIFRFLAPLLYWRPIMALGTRFYEMVANNRRTAGHLTRPIKFREFSGRTPVWQSAIALITLMFVFIWNIRDITTHWSFVDKDTPALRAVRRVTNSRTMQRVDWVSYLARLNQGGWGIFAPAPPQDDGWHVIVGTLADGTQVNLLNPDEPISFEKPSLGDRRRMYGNMQWRTYYINLNRSIAKQLYPDFGEYLCRRWQSQYKGRKAIRQIDVFFVDERTAPPGEPQMTERLTQWQQTCEE